MVTIKDVAKRAGVSISTVSNIINGKSTTRNETWHRVQKAISDLNYHPSFSARNLRSNKTKLIGIILPRLNSFYSSLYNGIVDQFKNSSCFPLLKLSMDDVLIEESILKDFLEVGISGLIIVSSSCETNSQIFESLRNAKLPLVLLERDIPSLSCDKILFDNSTLVYQTASDVCPGLSPDEIALIRLASDHSSESDTQSGFMQAAPDSPVIMVPVHRGEIFSELMYKFTSFEKPLKKIIVSNVDIAYAANDVCTSLGWKTEIFALSGDSWSVTQPYQFIRPIPRNSYFAGKAAAQRLTETIADPEVHQSTTVYEKNPPRHAAFTPVQHPHSETVRVLCLDSASADSLEVLSLPLAQNTGIHFEFDRKPYSELKASVTQAMEGECEYDILMIDKPWLQRCYQARLFIELGTEIANEISLKYPTYMYRIFYENRFRPYCIPFVAGVQAIYYRADVFQNSEVSDDFWQMHGVPLCPPGSWADYNRIVSFFTDYQRGSYSFKYGTMIQNADTIGHTVEFLPRQWAFNGSLFDKKGRARLDTIENERALQNLYETWTYTDPSLSGKVLDEDIFDALLKGTIPMAIGFANHYQPSSSEKSYTNFIETAPLPRKRAMVGGYLLGISRSSEKADICREYLRWIMSDTTSVSSTRMHGFIPTRAVYENSYLCTLNPWFSLLEQCSSKRCTRESVHNILGEEILAETLDSILSEMIQKALSGVSCRTALQETEKILNDMILCK